jgi:hypothetical protein
MTSAPNKTKQLVANTPNQKAEDKGGSIENAKHEPRGKRFLKTTLYTCPKPGDSYQGIASAMPHTAAETVALRR